MNLNQYKVISFDIFDTLVGRKIYRPKDLFSLMQSKLCNDNFFLSYPQLIDNFAELRINSEIAAREKKVINSGGEPEILITDIYTEMVSKCDDDISKILNHLIELEIASEKSVLYKCPEADSFFKKAKESDAKILIISDMYFPSNILKQLLEHCGYDTNDVIIFSSGEEGVSKHSGELYNLIKNKLNVDYPSWLHFGDNNHSDIHNAHKKKIKTFHANWSNYNPDRSYHWTAKDVIAESIYKSLQLKQSSKFYNNNSFSELGFKVFGPLLLGYISWMASQLKQQKVEKALFLARDAHLIHKLYQKYFSSQLIKSEYIFLSRKSSYMMGMTDWPMHRIWHLFGGKNRKSIKKILAVIGIDSEQYLDDIHNVGFPGSDYVPNHNENHKIHWLINKLFQQILLKNTKVREEYSEYFKLACGDCKNIALIDVGWMGNIQAVFARSLGKLWAEKNIRGFYLATFDAAKDNYSLYNPMFGWLTNYGHPIDKQAEILSGGVELIEFALADNTGSTIGYMKDHDELIIPIRDEVSESENDYLKKSTLLQNGIESFFEYVSPLLKNYSVESFNSVVFSEPFFNLVNNPNHNELSTLAFLTHAEAAGSNEERIPFVQKVPFKARILRNDSYEKGFEDSYWKEGFRRINRRNIWIKNRE